jgi:predicted transglutaminase-like cysteine proteinase
MIKYTNRLYQLLKKINRTANKIPYATDKERFRQEEFWTADMTRGGDCDDYMLYKRRQLIEAGVDWRYLYPTTMKIPGYGGHAVLLVRTDKGTFVLCNTMMTTPKIESYKPGGLEVIWLDYLDPIDRKWYSLYPNLPAPEKLPQPDQALQ